MPVVKIVSTLLALLMLPVAQGQSVIDPYTDLRPRSICANNCKR